MICTRRIASKGCEAASMSRIAIFLGLWFRRERFRVFLRGTAPPSIRRAARCRVCGRQARAKLPAITARPITTGGTAISLLLYGLRRRWRRPARGLPLHSKSTFVIGVVHSHTNFNQSAAGMAFDDIKTLEVRDESRNPLTSVSEKELPIASLGGLAGYEAGYRRGFGPRGTTIRLCGLN
jgi:hypothetical protein